MPDPPPHLRDDRYAITRLLGEGGQASTFEAVDKKNGTLVAVKRFQVRGAKSWKEVELAEREARVLAPIAHPALPRYVEHFEEGGELFLVTEKIEGESLAELKKRGGRLSEADVIRMLAEASEALEYLHGRAPPLIHRDLKPSNVIRRPDGSFAFIDFGSVRDRMRPEGGSTVVGTFGYMAPEQFQGRAVPATDVYALGATALAMLTGSEPEELPHRGLRVDVRAALGGRVHPSLLRALEAMLEPDPDRRPARLGPLLADLRRRDRARADPGEPRKSRTEARAEKRHRKRARRHARGRPLRVPGIVSAAFAIGLTVAQLAVILVMRVGLPILLHTLSLVFGRALREAAENVETAGKAAGEALRRAKNAVAGEEDAAAPEPPRIRVEPVAGESRVRVEPSDDEAEADAGAAEEAARRRLRG